MENKVSFTYWIEADSKYIGFLNDYPDHWTQGEDLVDLKEHLLDLHSLFTTHKIVGIRKVEELIIA
ncbi:MAG: type II toxin-antitoxin system HicB family antitoxin [Saprospiraceae bacterium]|nr:type II toxin-antitoxin system HicB family antitoxin [Saprospiraceae bacterium]MBK8668361.1 type II toxin-antitoxin system HicB family antitoxin [Saprospiraceae bacterium]MBK9736155.1 type II toxin-antitoxin system HicB family antitoxin [Saprospiraceae bacterium]